MSSELSSLLLAAFLVGCAPSVTPPRSAAGPEKAKGDPMSDPILERNRALVRSLYEECLNQGDLAALSRYIDETYVGVRGERGVEGFRSVIAGLRRGIPDIHFTLEAVLADRDEVAVRSSWRGTHLGQFGAFEPTGKTLTSTAIAIYRIREGKIVKAWLESDRLGFLQNIGVVDPKLGAGPAEPQAPAPAAK